MFRTSFPNLLSLTNLPSPIMSLNKRPRRNSCALCFPYKRTTGERNVIYCDQLEYKCANEKAESMQSY